MQPLAESLGLTIALDAPNQCLFTTWHGRHTGREKQVCCTLILEQVRRTGSRRLLSDGSQDLDGWRKVVRWLGTEYYAELQASGLLALALVLPRNLQARTNLHELLTTIGRATASATAYIALDTFGDVEGAYVWLVNKKILP